jgi:putative ABC transport system ATP-binding protein
VSHDDVATSDDVAARCAGVTRVYRSDTGEVPALRGIDLTVPFGAVTGVVGPSGAGKSTLLRLLGAIDRPTSGDVVVAGTATPGATDRALRQLRRRHVGVVRQRPVDNLLPQLDAEGHVRRASALRGVDVDVAATLDRVGLAHRTGHRPHELSGGEQQRLAVAVALVGPPTIVLADEPTGELDGPTGQQVVDVLALAAGEGAAVVLSTHEPAVQSRCDRVLHLHHGALHGESVRGGRLLATIDAAGRLQLPPSTWEWFPEGRAVVELGDGQLLIHPPQQDAP